MSKQQQQLKSDINSLMRRALPVLQVREDCCYRAALCCCRCVVRLLVLQLQWVLAN